MSTLSTIDTPAALIEQARMQHNIARMQQRMNELGVRFRPHVKTSKCIDVAKAQRGAGAQGITVSTLKEAEQFLAGGFTDILYAVGMAPHRLPHALELRRRGCALGIITDGIESARAIADFGRANGEAFDVLIEVDTDGHRSGIRPEEDRLLEVARVLHDGGMRLGGVMTHAGSSYDFDTPQALRAVAEQERAGCVEAAQRLRAAGHRCDIVSVGSTPTALSARSLAGVTEVRAGVYVFFDLVMAGVGVCGRDEIAISVLCSVIGHRPDVGWIITDAGWMAMSRDRGTQKQPHDFGYGAVCDVAGNAIEQLAFNDANQEHGVLQWTGARDVDLARRFPLGSQLRIVPNHACATGAQFDSYAVLSPAGMQEWPRFNGWS